MTVHFQEEVPPPDKLVKSVSRSLLKKYYEQEVREEDFTGETNAEKRQQDTNETNTQHVLEDDGNTEQYFDNGQATKKSINEPYQSDKVSQGSEPIHQEKSFQVERSASERFHYDIFWFGICVGEASLEAITMNDVLRITSQVHSTPFVSSIYKVEDFAESWVIRGNPFNFRIKQQEGQYKSNKETIFDMDRKTITFHNYQESIKHEHFIEERVFWDVISAFYYLRTQPLEIGKSVYIPIFDSNKFYTAKIDVLKKERIKLANKSGEIDTILVKPGLESEGLFQRKGDILIWLTDDEKRIPVKVATKVTIGSVVAELRDSEP